MCTVAHLTDPHLDEDAPEGCSFSPLENWLRAIEHIKQHPVDRIVFGGDIGAVSAHQHFFESIADCRTPFNLVLGNHDQYSAVSKFYSKTLQDDAMVYAEPISTRWHGLFLDSSVEEIGLAQIAWLKNSLLKSGPVIVFNHHPIFKVQTPVDTIAALKDREIIQQIFLEHPHPVLLFCGHYHLEDESQIKNVRQFITPAVSYQGVKESNYVQLDDSYFAYRRIEISKDHVSTELVRFDRSQ